MRGLSSVEETVHGAETGSEAISLSNSCGVQTGGFSRQTNATVLPLPVAELKLVTKCNLLYSMKR